MTRRVVLTWVLGALGAALLAAILLAAALVAGFYLLARKPTRPTGKVPIEFRILADRGHDPDASARALGPDGFDSPPAGYQWVRLDPRSGLESDKDAVLRDDPAAGVRFALVKVDPYNVREADMTDVYPTADDRLRPSIGFTFGRDGARRFGALTRAHLPEQGGAYKYRLGIILNGELVSAPSINSEIRDQGIIEGGGDKGFTTEEVNRLITLLTQLLVIDPAP